MNKEQSELEEKLMKIPFEEGMALRRAISYSRNTCLTCINASKKTKDPRRNPEYFEVTKMVSDLLSFKWFPEETRNEIEEFMETHAKADYTKCEGAYRILDNLYKTIIKSTEK